MKFTLKKIAISFLIVVSAIVNSETKKEEKEIMNFGMQVVMTAQPGKGNELASIMLKASELVSKMKGCKIYIVQVALDDSDKILITEVWESREDQQASLVNPEVRDLITTAKPIIVNMEYVQANTVGGKGL